jgi:ABC-2 type transport system ATP-binding protein
MTKKKTVIEINNLCKNYGTSRGVSKIDLKVYEGEIFGFIGPNGAGKSTTIRAMLNFLFPTSGEIKIFNLDAVTQSHIIEKDIGYVPAEVNYYDYMKVKDVLTFAFTFHDNIESNRINELCKRFDLNIDKKISELSLGNKKKVSIIQSLLHRPKLLILDEPTNGLDPLIQKKLFETLEEERQKGMTIFLSSHNLVEVEKYCDRVGIVIEGKIIDIKDVSKVNNSTIKKIVITTDKKIAIKIEGISDIEYINNELHFKYDGDIKNLLVKLTKYDIKDIAILPLTLEDEFLKYYGSR